MLNTKLPLAVCVALALTMGGCTTLKAKKTQTDDVQAQTSTSEDTNKDKTNGDASTNGLNGKEALNTNTLNNNQNTNDINGKNAGQTTNTKDNRANGDNISLTKMLAVRLVHFDYDSSDLSSEDLQTLQAHAQYLSQNPNAKVLLAGHADERGTREYNMALGERRANAVQAFLNSNGAKANQLDTVSFGKEKPLNDGHDDSSWAENRRVEISYKAGEPR